MNRTKLAPAVFATTRWTLIGHAADGAQSLAALGELLTIYWQPLYRYARRVGKSREEAEDLVQGFMERLIENESLRHPDPAKGRFRTFLLASFNHWMINEWKRGAREKRGGGFFHVPFDWQHAEDGFAQEPIDPRSPDRHYDREWALALLDATLNRLEDICRAEGGALAFGFLKPCLTADTERISYQELSASLSLSEGAARVAVHRLRKRYRQLLREEISRTLSDPSQAD
jgi:RNA polymerase sigma-70 factor (ECF subfamily)